MSAVRQLPADSRQRGLPSIGFSLEAPSDVEVTPVASGATVLKCCERRAGQTVGELEVAVFRAALVIDRDGILEEKVAAVVTDLGDAAHSVVHAPMPVSLPGASGFRGDVELRAKTPLRFVYVFAIAPHDLGVDGGVLVTVRCATPDWEAANAMMQSLRILTRRTSANDSEPAAPLLPMIGRRED